MKKENAFGLILALSLILSMTAVQLFLAGIVRGQSPYDVNGDGNINILDIIKWSESFGYSDGEDGFDSVVDVNVDGTIDLSDAVLISLNFT